MGTPGSSRRRRERGTGLIGSVAGVTVFLALLTVAVQVLVDLYQTSVVTAAGYDVARAVAAGPDQPPSARELLAAESRFRALLGTAGDDAAVEWEVDEAAGVLRLRVVVPTRRFLLPVVVGSLGLDEVDRTIAVRLEELQ